LGHTINNDSNNSVQIILHPSNVCNGNGLYSNVSQLNYGCKLLGCPIGSSEYCDKFVKAKFSSLSNEANRLLDLPSFQCRWLLLSKSFYAKINYMQRLLHPSLLSNYIDGFQNDCNRLLSSIIESPITDLVSKQVQLRIQSGGLGLPNRHWIGYAAYVGSVVEAMPFINESLTNEVVVGSNWFDSLSSSLVSFNNYLAEKLPSDNTTKYTIDSLSQIYLDNSNKSLQKMLSDDLDVIRVSDFKSILSDRKDILRYNSVSGLHAGDFLLSAPGDDSQTKNQQFFSNKAFSIALCFRLGLPLPIFTQRDNTTLICDCNKSDKQIDNLGYHIQNCARGGGWHIRHEAIVRLFSSLCFCADMNHQLLSKNAHVYAMTDHSITPDIRFVSPGFTDVDHGNADVLADVRITCPIGKTSMVSGSIAPGVSINSSRNQKNRKYSRISLQNGFYFMPLIMESFGAMDADMVNVIQHYSYKHADIIGMKPNIIFNYWCRRFSTALQLSMANFYIERVHSLNKRSSSSVFSSSSNNNTNNNIITTVSNNILL